LPVVWFGERFSGIYESPRNWFYNSAMAGILRDFQRGVSHVSMTAKHGRRLEEFTMDPPRYMSPETSLIQYPCHFPIKVMGANVGGYVDAMAHVAKAFDPTFDTSTIEQRPSKAGNYMGLTLKVYVTDREQLDELYRTLTTHPMVKIVL
jgi:uncharacterized protein